MTPLEAAATFGWCGRCQAEHRLESGGALAHAQSLMQELEKRQRIDYLAGTAKAEPRFSTDYLFGPALGQMFGVLEGEDAQGRTVILRAFSCQYNAAWCVDGWAPPLFDVAAYDQIMIPGDQRIKELGRMIESGTEDAADLKHQRKNLSRALMKELHGLYHLKNFRGETLPMTDFFQDTNGIPTGAGDCCAPKLLQQAASLNLRPLGLAEFYWGATNRSATRQHGQFYDSCASRCRPIMGFMLCGATS
jgi:hypothetical protein